MFHWLDRLLHWGTVNIGGRIIGFIRDMIHGVWGFLNSIFTRISESWLELFHAGHWLWTQAVSFGYAVFHKLQHIIRIIIPDVIGFFVRLFHNIDKLVHWVLKWAATQFAYVIAKIWHDITHALNWVIIHVYDPLARDISHALAWIFREGRIVYYYITHPGKLIDLVWDDIIAKLESEAWNVGARLGRFFLGLVLHNIKRFALLLEDIIMAVL